MYAKKYSVYVFEVADYEFSVIFYEFKTTQKLTFTLYLLVQFGIFRFLGSWLQIWSKKIKIRDGWPNMTAMLL